jgi:hypothetical protein
MPLASNDPRARYCSSRCRVRAHRARKRERPPLWLIPEPAWPPVEQNEEQSVEKRLVGSIIDAARHDWRAGAWLLERKYARWRKA